MRNFACLSLGLFASLLFAGDLAAQSQLEVRTSNVSQLDGGGGLRTIGDVVLLTDTDEIKFTSGVLIEVTSPAANVEIEVTDRDRRRVEYEPLDNTCSYCDGRGTASDGTATVKCPHCDGTGKSKTSYYLVTAEGKSWVDVTAIDFSQNIYKRSTGNVIEVTPALPGPSPEPQPIVPDPSQSLKELAQGIATKLSADKAKATSVATAFTGFAEAIRSVPISSVSQLSRVITESVKSLGMTPGTPVGADVDTLLATHIGITRDADRKWLDRPLTQADRDKAAEAFLAIAWAGSQVK